MLRKPAGNSVEQAKTKVLEHQYCEIASKVYQTIYTSSLDKFTFPLIDALWNDLNGIVQHFDRLPATAFKELSEVTKDLSMARNELRLARFLFEVEEINAVYRLIMRNKAVLRGKHILHKVLTVWLFQSS